MSNYIYGGAAAHLGRFGNLAQGDTIVMTAEEVAYVAGDADFAPLPTLLAVTIVEKTSNYTLLTGDTGKVFRTKQTGGITFTLPASPTVGLAYEIQDAGVTGAGTHNVTVDPTTEVIAGLENQIASIAVTAAGTGFTSIPTVVIAGGGTGTAATATVTAVSGGAITAISITTGGSYSAIPSSPASVTGGAGTGGTLNLTWGVESVTVGAAGTGYTSASASITGGAGTGATILPTLDPKPYVMDENAEKYGLYWNGAKWAVMS